MLSISFRRLRGASRAPGDHAFSRPPEGSGLLDVGDRRGSITTERFANKFPIYFEAGIPVTAPVVTLKHSTDCGWFSWQRGLDECVSSQLKINLLGYFWDTFVWYPMHYHAILWS